MPERRETTPTVYVLDDDDLICDCIQDVVESIGLRAETFTNAEAFLKQCPRDAVGCLVLDVRMPGIDGIAVQHRLQQEGCVLPVIFISAFAEVWTVVQAMKAGAFDFIEKPFSSQNLLGKVQGAIRENSKSQRAQAKNRTIESTIQSLTQREREILERIGMGMSSKRAASDLGISIRTVEFHRANLKRKLGVHSREAMTRLAISLFGDQWELNLPEPPRPRAAEDAEIAPVQPAVTFETENPGASRNRGF